MSLCGGSGGECLMKRIITGSRGATCPCPGWQWACPCDGHQLPGGPSPDAPCPVYQCYTFPSDWAAATKTTRPNYSIFSNSNPPRFPGAAILMCGKTGGEWDMMRHNKGIMLHFYHPSVRLGKDAEVVPRRYLSFLIFEYFRLINEASYLFCDSLSYIFQHLNNSHFTWPVKGNAIWSNFKRQLLRISLPSFKDVWVWRMYFSSV